MRPSAKSGREQRGVLFVVSLFDGVGAVFEALHAMGVLFHGMAFEREKHLREFVSDTWPLVEVRMHAEDADAREILYKAGECGAVGLLLAGGPPYQPFSGSSSAPRGFEDPQAATIGTFARLKGELSDICKNKGLPMCWFMEEVASMTSVHRDEITKAIGTEPALLHAADFGYVQRARLYWGLPAEVSVHDRDIEVLEPGIVAKGIRVVRWLGRPVPWAWQPQDDFVWAHRASCGTRALQVPGTGYAPSFPSGRFLAFASAFSHPADRPPHLAADDPYIYQRFLDDGRLSPLAHYVKGNMLWKHGDARALNVEEKEVLMGFRTGYSRRLAAGPHGTSDTARAHAIGNTFHVPSVVAILSVLFASLKVAEASVPGHWATSVPRSTERTAWVDTHARGTVWEERDRPFWCAGTVVEQALGLLPACVLEQQGAQDAVARAVQAMSGADVSGLALFGDYLQQSGAPGTATGPDIQALWAKSPMHAAVGRQHRPSTSGQAAPNLVEHGIGPERHAAEAQKLEHPFAAPPPLELDMKFVVDAYCALGLRIDDLRKRNIKLLKRLGRAVEEVDRLALACKHCKIEGVAGIRPAFIAVLVVLLRWLDRTLPAKLVLGFEVAGVIPPSGVLRPIEKKGVGCAAPADGQLFGQAARDFVDGLEASGRSKLVDPGPFEATVKEVGVGTARALVPRFAMDQLYGVGGWRPLQRHVVEQGGKKRPIDDGKASGTNALSTVAESNVCIPAEFALLAARGFHSALMKQNGLIPEWAAMRGTVEDWWKGYRQLQPTREHMALCIAAMRDPATGQWAYSQLLGLPFGLGAAVNQFVRAPMLLTAACRRLLYVMCGHYVDDNVILEVVGLGSSAASAGRCLLEGLAGVVLSQEKRRALAAAFVFLGHLHDLRPMFHEGAIVFEPKLGFRESVGELIYLALATPGASGALVSKIRGKATFLDSSLAGRCCRGALSALADVQHGEDVEVDVACVVQALLYLAAVAEKAPPRTFRLLDDGRPPVVVYTDASAGDGRIRIGALLLDQGRRPAALVYDVPEHLVEAWKGNAGGINQGELYAANVLAFSCPERIRGRDVLWFIDNTSAESALVKCGSTTPSMARLALQASMAFVALGARAWFEHVPSADNPSDVLSRDGFADEGVARLIAQGGLVLVRACEPPLASYSTTWDQLNALGSGRW